MGVSKRLPGMDASCGHHGVERPGLKQLPPAGMWFDRGTGYSGSQKRHDGHIQQVARQFGGLAAARGLNSIYINGQGTGHP